MIEPVGSKGDFFEPPDLPEDIARLERTPLLEAKKNPKVLVGELRILKYPVESARLLFGPVIEGMKKW